MSSQEKRIGDLSVRVEYLSAWEGVEISQSVLKLIGPALGSIAKLAAENGTGAKLSPESMVAILGGALASAFEKSPPRETVELMKRLFAVVQVKGDTWEKWANMNEIFSAQFKGKTILAYKIAAFAIEVNFSDFFSEAVSMIPESDQPKP